MENTFTTTVVPPNPLRYSVGRPLLAEGVGQGDDFLDAQNWCHAHGGAQNVIEQNFGGDLFSVAAVMPAAGTWHCRWAFPILNAAFTSVRVHVFAEYVGAATGSVRFQSFGGGDNESITINPGAAAWYTGAAQLTVADGGGGYELVNFTAAGDGADETIVHTVVCDWLPKTSALPAAAAGAFRPFDADERDADSVCSAAIGRRIIDNLAELMARKRVYYQWSGIAGISSPMEDIEHAVWVPIHYDALTQNYTVTVVADVEGVVGASKLYIYANDGTPGHPGAFYDTFTIDVANGAARTTTTKTITLVDKARLGGVPHPMTKITFWPGTRTQSGVGDFGPADSGRRQNDGTATPLVYAVSIFGV